MMFIGSVILGLLIDLLYFSYQLRKEFYISPDKIDSAIQRAVDNLKNESHFEYHTDDLVDMVGKANIDAKVFAISLVQETLHELFDEE